MILIDCEMISKKRKGDNMALIKCPECNKDVSDSAEACPNCGYGIKLYVTSPCERERIENARMERESKENEKRKLEKEKKYLIAQIRANPRMLEDCYNPNVKVSCRTTKTLYAELMCIYEYKYETLWISLYRVQPTDEDDLTNLYEYVCKKCYEAYIDEEGYIRAVGTGDEYGEIGTFLVENYKYKTRRSKFLPHSYPCDMEYRSEGCYIATAIYGSYDCLEVLTLRRFRDEVLSKTWYGKVFIQIYYAVSPKLIEVFGEVELVRGFCKKKLDRVVSYLNGKGISPDKYIDKA